MKKFFELFKTHMTEGESKPTSYSGRGMYGRECVGVSGDGESIREIIAELICYGFRDVEDMAEDEPCGHLWSTFTRQLLNYKTDSMGYGKVFYWPEWSWEYFQQELGQDSEEDND